MKESESFFGLHPRWLGADRFYKVFVTPKLLSGARVAGQVYDGQVVQAMARAGYGPSGPLQERAEREAEYASVDPTSETFLSLDQHNFQIHASAAGRISFSHRKSWWTGGLPNMGVLTFDDRRESPRRLILVGNQDVVRIQKLLKGAGFVLHDDGAP